MNAALLKTVRVIRNGLLGAILIAMPLMWSCNDEDLGRSEFLIVSDTLARVATNTVNCRIAGGPDTLYVYSNVEYDISFETDDEEIDWITVNDAGIDKQTGSHMYIIESTPLEGTFQKRQGTLSFKAPKYQLGQYLTISQGFTSILADDFEWLRYGSESPYEIGKETSIDNWTAAQKEYGWTSTKSEGESITHCYGKYGYLKLGSAGHGADLITPLTIAIERDTIAVLTFKAVSFISSSNVKDNNKLKVEILNGGVFTDMSSTKTIELKYFDNTDSFEPQKTMWDESYYSFFIVSTETSPFTQDTRIRFVADDLSGGKNNRVFLDDIYIYNVDEDSYYLADEEANR